jgi:PadR family transcriptional regulator
MASERYLGELEQMVLLAVLRLDDGAYGSTVLDEIEGRTGRELSRGGLYVTLDRLVEKGLLDARMGEPSPERGGRPPRLVTVTGDGLAELRKSRRAFASLSQGLEAVLEEG